MNEQPERGPIYGVPLILQTLPIGGGMYQAMPSRADLEAAKTKHCRLVAGYEVLLTAYHKAIERADKTT